MNDMPTPPKKTRTDGKWSAALRAVTSGKVVYFPDLTAPDVSGNVNRPWIDAQGFRVRTARKDQGCVAWIERRESK